MVGHAHVVGRVLPGSCPNPSTAFFVISEVPIPGSQRPEITPSLGFRQQYRCVIRATLACLRFACGEACRHANKTANVTCITGVKTALSLCSNNDNKLVFNDLLSRRRINSSAWFSPPE